MAARHERFEITQVKIGVLAVILRETGGEQGFV